MGTPLYATRRGASALSRRGLGIVLIVAGLALVVPGVVFTLLCSPVFLGVCLPQPYDEIAGFVAGVGFTLVIVGPLLVFTRWQFSRNLGFCPSCGADIRPADKFCGGCGNRLW